MRASVTRAIKAVLRKTRALDLVSRITAQNRIEILLYHGFCESAGPDGASGRFLPIDDFEEHIRIFRHYGKPLSLDELAQGLHTASSGIAITMDDGYANNHLALAVLEKYDFPATVFLTTGFLDKKVPLWGDWLEFLIMTAPARHVVVECTGAKVNLNLAEWSARSPLVTQLKLRLRTLAIGDIHDFLRTLETQLSVRYDWDRAPEALRPLHWDDVRAMRRSGLISFGGHTVSHPVLSSCDSHVQLTEVRQSKRRIEEELGEACSIFAYPYGQTAHYTPTTKQIVREAGYRFALTAEPGFNTPAAYDRYALKRWGAEISAEELSFLVSGGPVLSEYLANHFGRRYAAGIQN